ncbi:MAG TPA: GNAT family protein [Methylomirabilota bacterium]|nr:GNAT family protein [Methylomirabilota bacterium]
MGNVYLRDIDWLSRHAALGVFIGERDCRGKGYGSQALRLMLRHAFQDLGLRRVYLFALADNEGALATYRKVGFTLEGTMRQHIFKAGRFRDIVVLGIHADEWERVAGA